MDIEAQKRQAAARALDWVRPGMRLVLGTGSTAKHFVDLLGERVRSGLDVIAVPTSEVTRAQAKQLNIPLTTLDETPALDLTVDGADEIGPDLTLIKGGGGALLREKIVVAASERFVVVAEAAKKVERLGEGFRLPVEVVRFAWEDTARRLASVLPEPELRKEANEPYVTDEGHYILDVALPPGSDLDALDVDLRRVPGVVEHGLFVGMASQALLGTPEGGVEVLSASD